MIKSLKNHKSCSVCSVILRHTQNAFNKHHSIVWAAEIVQFYVEKRRVPFEQKCKHRIIVCYMGVAQQTTDVKRHQGGKECILFLDPSKSLSICKELTGLQRFINTVNSPTCNSDSKLNFRYRFSVDIMCLNTRKRHIKKWFREAKVSKHWRRTPRFSMSVLQPFVCLDNSELEYENYMKVKHDNIMLKR